MKKSTFAISAVILCAIALIFASFMAVSVSADTLDYIPGDVDGNGVINMLDVLLLCQYYVDGCKYDPDGYAVELYPGRIIHDLEEIEAKRPTCTEKGNIAYWHCTDCGKYFSDTEGLNEISLNDVVLPALGHDFEATYTTSETEHWYKCSRCDAVKDKEVHNWDDGVVTTPATETTSGVMTYTCAVCGGTMTEEIPVLKSKYSEGLAFTLKGDGTCYVSGIGTCEDTDIIIPSVSPDGDTVTSIGSYAFCECYSLTNIEIPASVTIIGYFAFQNCRSLTSIEIPASVTSIGICAFEGCRSLTSIEIPASVTSIGEGAFIECCSLTSVEIPASVTNIGASAFSGCSSLTSIMVAEGNTVYHSAGNCLIETASKTLIAGCNNSVIPTDGSVTSIGEGVFEGCRSLTSIEIPASVTSIGERAFLYCSALTSIEIPASVTSIGEGAFYGCDSLTSVNITDISKWCGISFGDNPIYYTHNLYLNGELVTELVIPEGVTIIKMGAFGWCESLISIEIPASVTSIETWAFFGCTSLTSITVAKGNSVYHSAGNCLIETASKTLIAGCKNSVIPTDGSVTSIGNAAFQDCLDLTSIEIPASITSIGGYQAFVGCSSLTSVTFAENSQLINIGDIAFYYCEALKSIEIPANVTSIGRFALSHCSALEEIIFLGTEEEWNAIEKGENWDESTGDYVIIFRTNNSEGLAFTSNGDGTCYISGIGTCTDTDIIIPSVSPDGDTVTSIGDSAFEDCSSLTSIEIPASVTSIGNYAFRGCKSLTSIEIPASVTSIGNYAFDGCSSLTSITFAENSQLTSIGNHAFDGCGFTSIEIPEGVTSIGNSAFAFCGDLTSITIPASVTSIGNEAFESCAELMNVNITDIAKWCEISFGSYGANPLSYASDLYINGELVTELVIPEGVTSIVNYAFAWCESLTSITFAENSQLTSIGDDAFYYCSSLTIIEIPASITSIGERAFYGCSSLASIKVAEGNTVYYSVGNCLIETASKTLILGCKNSVIPTDDSVTSIGERAFDGCKSLTSIEIPASVTSIRNYAFEYCRALTSITFAENSQLTSIGDYAFRNCSKLTSIKIPASVTSIGNEAFEYCSSLTSINYSGTKAQWNAISKGSRWNSSTGKYTVYCTDGNISKANS